MKKWFKQLFSSLLCAVMALTLLPADMWATDGADAAESVKVLGTGLIPDEGYYVYPTAEDIFDALGAPEISSLPTKYDARQYQTPVKDQAYSGLCWAFSAIGAIEANMKKNGMGTKDFSELHMGCSVSTYYYNGKLVNAQQGSFGSNGSVHNAITDGGNREKASSYIMRGSSMSGLVYESKDPFSTTRTDWSSLRDPQVTENITRNYKNYTIKDVMFLTGSAKSNPQSESEIIKNAIMSYGAVQAYIYMDQTGSYYNSSTGAYYWNGGTKINHAVLVVGWDDNYSRNNFNSSHRPGKNGAWLMKNSWGTGYGRGIEGYYWVSYEDTSFPSSAAAYVGGRTWAKADHIYESDYKDQWHTAYSSGGEFAKVFPIAKKNDRITSVRIFLPYGGSIKAQVDVIPTFKSFSGYTFSAKATRSIAYPGWYTIDLDKPITLGASGSFAVVVRLSGVYYLGCDTYNNMPSGVTAYVGNGSSYSATSSNLAIKAVSSSASTASPTAPKDVKAVISGSSVKVTWSEVKKAEKYAIYRKAGDGSWEKLNTKLTGTAYTDKTVKAGTTYAYRLRAYVGEAWSGYSSSVKISLPAADVPAGVTAAAASSSAVKVTWNTVKNATKYAVYRMEDGGSWENLNAKLDAEVFTDKTVKPGTTYYYRVRAYVGGAWGGYSAKVKVAVPAASAPSGIKADVTGSAVKLTWNTVKKAAKYAVYRMEDGGSWEKLNDKLTVAAYTDKTVRPGTTYYYRVRAYVGAWSGYSSKVKAAVPQANTPAGVTAEAVNGTVRISWAAVKNAERYAVYRMVSGGEWERLDVKVTALSYTDRTAAPNTTYYYRVRAYVGGAWGGYSAKVKIVTPDAELPAAPDKPVVKAAAGKITVSWRTVDGAAGYTVWRREKAGDSWGKWTQVKADVTATSYTDKKVTAGNAYQYRLKAVNAAGESDFSPVSGSVTAK